MPPAKAGLRSFKERSWGCASALDAILGRHFDRYKGQVVAGPDFIPRLFAAEDIVRMSETTGLFGSGPA
jgi:hypothetical protein